ncbi:hypothetical protein DFH07DRAFT_774935 [Mycena maculata]|uniref:Uncharacterized protein n=1 Tax=Mycena maculata TaxID=230809 RepID=A0AAD7N927_9AGAR|nr:hypothetical protein DFH07DRAFT_774935 [Mycena maculata]
MEKENGEGAVKKFHITLSDTSLTPAEQGGSKKDMQPVAQLEASGRQEHKLMEEIKKHHACQEHTSKACYVMGSATIGKVLDELKIEDQIERQRGAKKGLNLPTMPLALMVAVMV